jgi:2-polyprenyl-6-methoxyphenol hydroxylase-like FAD-dependent oxidoreductase
MRYAALPQLGHGLGVHRAALFDVLHDAAVAERVPIATGCPVTGVDDSHIMIGSRREGPFDLVVDALGSSSPLRAKFPRARAARELEFGAIWGTVPWVDDGFEPAALTQRYLRSSVMIGVLPIGRKRSGGSPLASFFWSLKAREHRDLLERGFEAWADRVRTLWPETAPHLDALGSFDALSLARYAHATLPTPAGDRLVAIGDAAHSTSPQLGQGANMALLDARALSLALRELDLADALTRYVRLRRWHVRLYQMLSLSFTPLYQSDSRWMPILRDALVPIATTVPPLPQFLALLVAGQLLNPLPALELPAPV